MYTWRQSLVAHGACLLFKERFWGGFAITFQMAESFRVAIFSVSLQAEIELPSKISSLDRE